METMERAYYYNGEELVFLTREDAAQFYFDESIYSEMDYYLNDFLESEGYTRESIFVMTDEEKSEVLSDYHDFLFNKWVDSELIAVDIFNG